MVSLDRPAADGRPSALALLGIGDELVSLEVDLLDGDAVSRALADHDVETVFHLGAQTIVGTPPRRPRRRRSK